VIEIRLDVPALERLIGGDSQVEIDLRRGVVEAFAKTHLTKILKDETFAKFLADEAKVIEAGLNALVSQHIGFVKDNGWSAPKNVILHPAILTRLEGVVEAALSAVVQEKIGAAWAAMEPALTKRANERLTALTDAHVQRLVNERLAKLSAELAKS